MRADRAEPAAGAPSGAPGAGPLLAVRRASKRYDGEVALEDASFELRAGEVHALMGENGAGKSTLIKLLAGVELPDVLDVRVDGRAVVLRTPADAHRAGLRFLHQELNVVPALSVAENLFLGRPYPRTPLGTIAWRRLRSRARETLGVLGVEHLEPTRPMRTLDTGDAMLVSIARAFADDGAGRSGRIYVLDEPTAALSRRETDLLFAVVRRLRAAGAGIVYVSHRIEEIFELADRVTVLRDGRVVSTTEIADASREGLIRDMTGRRLRDVVARVEERSATRDDATVAALEARGVRSDHVGPVGFALAAGEVLGVAGLAGSGRSELLRALLGADQLTSGEVRLFGRQVRFGSPAAAWGAGVAYVPEERRGEGLAMQADVRANLLLPHLARVARFGFVRRGDERRETRHWSDEVGLRSRGPRQPVHELSGGNQQKVVLARALAGRPSVLLLDEPTRGVDVGAKADIYDLVRSAAEDGTAVLLASSDLDEILAVCDRVLILRDRRGVDVREVRALDRASLLNLCYPAEEAA